jgi:pimeloyl-ACP methyl ester carboxylesterase
MHIHMRLNRPHPVAVRMLATALVVTSVSTGAVALSATTDDASASAPAASTAPSTLTWGPCPPGTRGSAPAPAPRDPRQRCASVTVPLDYQHPQGTKIKVEISRILTSKPGEHEGDLLIGPGGPGEPGLEDPSAALTTMPAAVLDHYDIYSLDYRGIGNSSPVDCDISTADRAANLSLPYPAPDGSITANVAFAKQVAADCAAHGGAELPYITTANTARDLDRIRIALGDQRISYYGTSYGTYLGMVYAQLFPSSVDHMVLNSVDPPGGLEPALQGKGIGVEQAFDAYANWVAPQDSTYHLGTTLAAVRSIALDAESALDSDPLPVSDTVDMTGNDLRIIVESLLEQPTWFPALSELLEVAATRQVPAGGLGSVLPVAMTVSDNFLSSQDAVICGDSSWPSSPASYAAQVKVDQKLYPLTNGAPGNIWPCAYWPYRPTEAPVTITGNGPRDIMMIQNANDPSTAYSGAEQTRRTLGRRAEMITVTDGIGHGVPLTNTCVMTAFDGFLVGNDLPARDLRCS